MKLNPNVLGTRQDRQYPREGAYQKGSVPVATAAGGSGWVAFLKKDVFGEKTTSKKVTSLQVALAIS